MNTRLIPNTNAPWVAGKAFGMELHVENAEWNIFIEDFVMEEMEFENSSGAPS